MIKPLILDFTLPRRDDGQQLVYSYDNHLNLNVVATKTGSIPFIQANYPEEEFVTKTFKKPEADDQPKLEMDTMTKVAREGTDEDILSYCAQLETSTRVAREADDIDARRINPYLELATKTDCKRESDDTL